MGALMQIRPDMCHVGHQESKQTNDNTYRKFGLSELLCSTREYSTAVITVPSVLILLSHILLSMGLPISATRERRILQEQ